MDNPQTDMEKAEKLIEELDNLLEEAAKMIEDWHIPAKGGTHSMAFAIRAAKERDNG